MLCLNLRTADFLLPGRSGWLYPTRGDVLLSVATEALSPGNQDIHHCHARFSVVGIATFCPGALEY